jgi:hypothetical protein
VVGEELVDPCLCEVFDLPVLDIIEGLDQHVDVTKPLLIVRETMTDERPGGQLCPLLQRPRAGPSHAAAADDRGVLGDAGGDLRGQVSVLGSEVEPRSHSSRQLDLVTILAALTRRGVDDALSGAPLSGGDRFGSGCVDRRRRGKDTDLPAMRTVTASRPPQSPDIPKLTDFWAWQLLGEPAYERNPLRAHQPVHARTPFGEVHYLRWLELFETTVNELFAGPVAELAKGRARRMATAMRRLLDGESAIGDAAVEVRWAKESPRSTRP